MPTEEEIARAQAITLAEAILSQLKHTEPVNWKLLSKLTGSLAEHISWVNFPKSQY